MFLSRNFQKNTPIRRPRTLRTLNTMLILGYPYGYKDKFKEVLPLKIHLYTRQYLPII